MPEVGLSFLAQSIALLGGRLRVGCPSEHDTAAVVPFGDIGVRFDRGAEQSDSLAVQRATAVFERSRICLRNEGVGEACAIVGISGIETEGGLIRLT